VARVGFEDYFTGWIDAYAGRTAHGFAETSRSLYRRAVEDHALPRWRTWKLGDVEPADVRALYADLRDRGLTVSAIKAVRAPLSAMFATAVEDGLVHSNPIQGIRIPADADAEADKRQRRSPAKSWGSCWPRYRTSGGCSSSSLPTPGCGSPRRSRSAGSTLTSAPARGCSCANRSTRGSASGSRANTVGATFHCRQAWRDGCSSVVAIPTVASRRQCSLQPWAPS
jgi:hypothetical protein